VWIVCCCDIADVVSRLRNKAVLWQERDCNSNAIAGQMLFNGIPFVVVGNQTMECCYGKRSGSAPPGNQQLVRLIYYCITHVFLRHISFVLC